MASEIANPVDADTVNGGGEEGNRAPRLPRWTRQEILVLIQGKRVAESKVRRIRTAEGSSGQVEPKWASVSSYCRMHGVNRGPVQCRKRWSNLAGDFKKIKEWESSERDSFWSMRNDLRRDRKLPGFFDKEVYDILDRPPAAVPLFDSRRAPSAEDGMFSDFEQEGEKEPQAAEVPSSGEAAEEGRKKRKRWSEGEEERRSEVVEVLERNGNALAAHLEAQKAHFQHSKAQSESLVGVLNKLADALLRISDKL